MNAFSSEALAPRNHNNPPLEETIVLDFDLALREYDFDLLARIEELEAKARTAGRCDDAETAGRYGDAVKAAVAAMKAIEAERELLNRPLLNAQRALMGRTKVYSERLSAAEKRIRALLDDYIAREKLRREAEERERLRIIAEAEAKAAREAEVERQRLQAIADAEADAERRRLQAIADLAAAKERARLQAIEEERAAAEAREVKPVEVVAEVVRVEAKVVEVVAAPVAYIPLAPVYDAVRSDRGVLVTDTETWHVEIENIRQVPDIFLKNEAVIEALRKVIAPSVRGKTGLRAIKGCHIYATTKASVR